MKNKRAGSRYIFGLVAVLALFLALGLWPKGGMIQPDVVQAKITEGMAEPAEDGVPFHENHPGIRAAIAVQERHSRRLLTIPEVAGTAVGLTETGQPAVLIFLKGTPPPGILPDNFEGVPVVVKFTGAFVAMPAKGPGIDPTSRFDRPVPIGVSTGNIGECSAGTIGARVSKGGDVYALSNNHVYALENEALKESKILQPGRYDTNCVTYQNDVIGTLSDFIPLDFSEDGENTVDAGIALTSIASLGNATPAGGYGTPKSQFKSAGVNDAVQKYGRTSKLTKGTITGINATINVGYSNGTAVFVNQIVVYSNKPFIKAGDSGSLLVSDPDREPVGLLFAGSSSGKYAIANHIDSVLGAFGVSIDGN